MEVFQIVSLGVIGAILVMILRKERPELGLLLSLVVGLILLGFVMERIMSIFGVLRNLAWETGLNLVFLNTVFRVIGVAYIAEFGAQICRDAGEGVIANKIEMGAKVLIMIMALPVFLALLEAVLVLLP